MVRACVFQGFGINADQELITALQLAGADPNGIHVSDILEDPGVLRGYAILAFPGGFSFGDHLGSGRVLAALLGSRIRTELDSFVSDGGLVIGICNGFQVLAKMGLLPGRTNQQEVSLIHNSGGRFVDAWVGLAREPRNRSPWLGELGTADMPIRHGEGRFVCDAKTLGALEADGRIAFRYSGANPNGSLNSIAGITDGTGRVLGLMPHPEAYLSSENHPTWHRDGGAEPTGIALFRNAVAFSEGLQ